jgi:predicted RNase H-like HicB family nuclease
MTFTYPAVFTPHKEDKGYYVTFPDLDGCWGEGPDLEDAIEDAKHSAYNWLMVELEEEGGGHFPARSHVDDIELGEGCFVKELMIIIKLLPDSD